MNVQMVGCCDLNIRASPLFPPSDALFVLGSSYSTADETFHIAIGYEALKIQFFSKYAMYFEIAAVGRRLNGAAFSSDHAMMTSSMGRNGRPYTEERS